MAKSRFNDLFIIPFRARFCAGGRQVVHILHVPKTGGTALQFALTTDAMGCRKTPTHIIFFRNHSVTLSMIPKGHKVIFGVRDPVARFVSAFYSRLRGGRFCKQRSDLIERNALTKYGSPQNLAEALLAGSPDQRRNAHQAMKDIRHVNEPIKFWLGSPELLETRKSDILFVYRQETLLQDFERMKKMLGLLTLRLPDDPRSAHRLPDHFDRTLSEEAVSNIKAWYAGDYDLLESAALHYLTFP